MSQSAFTGPSAVTGGGIIYVAAPTGVAATDAAAIQAAHDALDSSGGEVVMCPGGYQLDPSHPLVFTKSIHLRGAGKSSTILSLDSATVNGIATSAGGCIFEDFTLKNTHATAATAGAGIVTTAVAANTTTYRGILVEGFYRNVDEQYSDGFIMEGCRLLDPVFSNIRVQNLDNADAGDSTITETSIFDGGGANLNSGSIGIEWNSSGGLRVVNSKFNAATSFGGGKGILIKPSDGIVTSVIIVEASSIENYQHGIYGDLFASHTGVVEKIIVDGNEFLASVDCVSFDIPAAGKFLNIQIVNNTLTGPGTGGVNGIVLGNVDNVTTAPNNFDGIDGSKIVFNSGVTNARVYGFAKIYDVILGADTASIDTGANGIPAGYSSLRIEFIGRTDDAATTGGIDVVVNNDTSSIYDIEAIDGTNATASAVASNAQAKWGFAVTGASALANYAGVVIIELPGYDHTTWFKSGRATLMRATDVAADSRTNTQAVGYRSTAAISQVKVAARSTAKLKVGSRLIIYGLP